MTNNERNVRGFCKELETLCKKYNIKVYPTEIGAIAEKKTVDFDIAVSPDDGVWFSNNCETFKYVYGEGWKRVEAIGYDE